MPEEKGWANAVPEMYFDLIGRVPPGLFLSIVLLVVFIPNIRDTARGISKAEWGPSLISIILLAFAAYSIGLLISPTGIWINRKRWRIAWEAINKDNNQFNLLQRVYADLQLGFPLATKWEDLSLEQRDFIYRHLHELLKINVPEAKLLLPRLAAELGFALNSIVALFIGSLLLLSNWAISNWSVFPVNPWLTPRFFIAVFIFLCAFLASVRAAEKGTQHLVRRHYAFLGEYLRTTGKK
jgi:hypothetical protein